MCAFYTSSIKTHYYEPTVFSAKNRAEFRLDSDKLFLSNMRLLQVSNNSINNPEYKHGCGVMQTVRTLELLDGSKTLCRLDNVDSLYSFKRVNNSNEENLIKSNLDKTSVGYVYTPADLTTVNAQITFLDIEQPLYDTVEGYIDLNDLLPFLKASQIVPTQVFKNLKLALTYYNGGEPDWTGATPPLLAVDEMLNTDVADAMLKSYKGFIWTEMERDQYVVPAISQTDLVDKEVRVQSVRNQLKGFDNKMVKRCFIQKQTPGDFYSDFGLQGSAPQNRERLQVRKNGSNIYAGNGLDSPALIQNEVVQIWGEMNKTLLGVFQPDVIDQGLLGDYYMAFDLTGNRTNELQIEYQRTVLKDNADTNNNRTSLALTMNVYGEVEKVIQVNGDMTYRVMYA